jgi:cold-inducible RNA-binding protein
MISGVRSHPKGAVPESSLSRPRPVGGFMGKKLYVGNLAFSVTDQELQNVFAAFGTVESSKVITDRDSGRSKGFGFIEMSSEDEANNAINELNGKEQNGRPLTVSEAKPQAPRDSRGGGGGGGRGGGGGFGRSRY